MAANTGSNVHNAGIAHLSFRVGGTPFCKTMRAHAVVTDADRMEYTICKRCEGKLAKMRAVTDRTRPAQRNRTMASARTSHAVVVVIRTDDPQSAAAARERLHRWLETFGHTASSFGFEFTETRPVVAAVGIRIKQESGK